MAIKSVKLVAATAPEWELDNNPHEGYSLRVTSLLGNEYVVEINEDIQDYDAEGTAAVYSAKSPHRAVTLRAGRYEDFVKDFNRKFGDFQGDVVPPSKDMFRELYRKVLESHGG